MARGDGPYREYESSVQAVVDLFGPIDFAVMKDAPTGPVAKFLGNLREGLLNGVAPEKGISLTGLASYDFNYQHGRHNAVPAKR